MKPKPPGSPQDNDKTAFVGRRGPAERPGSEPPDDGKTMSITNAQAGWSDDGKTMFVDSADQGAGEGRDTQKRGDEPSSGRMRAGPSQRLAWPARDQSRPVGDRDNTSTRPVGGDHPGSADLSPSEDATRLFNPNAKAPRGDAPAVGQPSGAPAAEAADSRSDDPVVGWLVVVQGPGKGRSLEIGIGANAIGRERGQKICLNFGDGEIHRDKHAVLVFDPRSRRFYLQGGDVRNLTYLGDDLVLTPVELKGGETIIMGQTHMRFVPFCGPTFGWS